MRLTQIVPVIIFQQILRDISITFLFLFIHLGSALDHGVADKKVQENHLEFQSRKDPEAEKDE